MKTAPGKQQSTGAVRSGGVFGDSDHGAGDGKRRKCVRTAFCLDLMAWLLLDRNGTLDTYYLVMQRQQPCPHAGCVKCRRSPNGKAHRQPPGGNGGAEGNNEEIKKH